MMARRARSVSRRSRANARIPPPRARAAATSLRRSTAPRTSEPEQLARIVDGLGRLGERVVFPAHPRTRACSTSTASSSAERRAARAARLPRHGRARRAGARARHRLGRPAEGGVLVRRPLRHARGRRRSGSTPSSSARTSSSTTIRRGSPPRSPRRGCPTTRPPLYGDGHAAERVAASLAALAEGPSTTLPYRRRLRRRSARRDVRRGGLPRPPRRRASRTSSPR